MLFGTKCRKYCRLVDHCLSNTVCIFDEDGCSEEHWLAEQQDFLVNLLNSCNPDYFDNFDKK